jgi:hypothetical protein
MASSTNGADLAKVANLGQHMLTVRECHLPVPLSPALPPVFAVRRTRLRFATEVVSCACEAIVAYATAESGSENPCTSDLFAGL